MSFPNQINKFWDTAPHLPHPAAPPRHQSRFPSPANLRGLRGGRLAAAGRRPERVVPLQHAPDARQERVQLAVLDAAVPVQLLLRVARGSDVGQKCQQRARDGGSLEDRVEIRGCSLASRHPVEL